ncbi:hypothetical protein AAG906_003639 [Vitis piasezkii]
MPKENCLLLLQGTSYTNDTSTGEGRLRHHYIEDKTFTLCCAFSSLWYSSSLDGGEFLGNIYSGDHLKLAFELHLASLPFSLIPSFARDDSRIDLYHANRPTGSSKVQMDSSDYMVFPMETSPIMPSCSNPSTGSTQINRVPNGMENGIRTPKWMSWIL